MAAADYGVNIGLAFTAPQALWLLLALPVVWVSAWRAPTTFAPRQRWLQAATRSLLLAALALALAQPVLATG